jgi:hypothetical protein
MDITDGYSREEGHVLHTELAAELYGHWTRANALRGIRARAKRRGIAPSGHVLVDGVSNAWYTAEDAAAIRRALPTGPKTRT